MRSASKRKNWEEWLHRHDREWSFLLPYLLLSVLLTVFLSLFWLALIIGLHGLIEVIRLAPRGGWWPIKVLAQLQLDLAVLIFALVLDFYLSTMLGGAGSGPLARAAALMLSRFAGWLRVVRIFPTLIDELLLLIKAYLSKRASPEDPSHEVLHLRLETVPAVLSGVSLALLAASPWLIGASPADAWESFQHAMTPFPSV